MYAKHHTYVRKQSPQEKYSVSAEKFQPLSLPVLGILALFLYESTYTSVPVFLSPRI